MIDHTKITYTDLVALSVQAADIGRAAERLTRCAKELKDSYQGLPAGSTNTLQPVGRPKGRWIEDQLQTIEVTIAALRQRFPVILPSDWKG